MVDKTNTPVPGSSRQGAADLGTSVRLVVPPKFSAAVQSRALHLRGECRAHPAPGLSSRRRLPESSQPNAAFFSVGRAQRYCVPFNAGIILMDQWLCGLTMLRQSRSPRRRPWISTSAVATLEAKAML